MIKHFSFFFFLLIGITLSAQKNIFLKVSPIFNGESLQMGTTLTHGSGESYALDHFDYYISDVLITHDGGVVSTAMETVYLVEPGNHTLYIGALDVTMIEQVEFTVGVPDRLNTQQGIEAADISTYPETHPLSFQIPSMYWGWSFGYMPMIIGGGEGGSYFEVHSVGPNLQRQVNLPVIQTEVSATQINLELQCHVDRWVNGLELSTAGILHGATTFNELIMDNVNTENVFTLSPSASLLTIGQIQPNVYANEDHIYYSGLPVETANLELYDQLGRKIFNTIISSSTGVISINSNHSGPVFVFFKDTFGSVVEKQTIYIP